MPQITAKPGERASLRQDALQRLSTGRAPPTRSWGVSVEALTLLHRLASSPGSAADALKLLHELQVHQVELDLQQAQFEANENELNEGLAHYRMLYEQAPNAYFVLNPSGEIEECNRAGAALLEAPGEEVSGRHFGAFLSAEGRLRLAALLETLPRGGATSPSCRVQPANTLDDSHRWQMTVSTVPASEALLLVVTPGSASPVN
jgi:PAS domain-containing protein